MNKENVTPAPSEDVEELAMEYAVKVIPDSPFYFNTNRFVVSEQLSLAFQAGYASKATVVDRESLLKLRDYFGENDKTPFQHWAFHFLDNMIKGKATVSGKEGTIEKELLEALEEAIECITEDPVYPKSTQLMGKWLLVIKKASSPA